MEHDGRAAPAQFEQIGCLRTMRLAENLHRGSPWVEALPDYRTHISSEKAGFSDPSHRINLNTTSAPDRESTRCGELWKALSRLGATHPLPAPSNLTSQSPTPCPTCCLAPSDVGRSATRGAGPRTRRAPRPWRAGMWLELSRSGVFKRAPQTPPASPGGGAGRGVSGWREFPPARRRNGPADAGRASAPRQRHRSG